MERDVTEPQITGVRCNLCGKDVNKNALGYLEDHISLSKTWGYHSPYDGEAHDIDICVACYKDLVQRFEIPPSIA